MINYSLDSDIRKKVIVGLFIISFAINIPLNYVWDLLFSLILKIPVVEQVVSQFEIIGVVAKQLSIIAVFGLLYTIFSKWMWKLRVVKRFTKVPDLNGEWEGVLESSHKDPDTKKSVILDITATITQTWNAVQVICHFPNSSSYSRTATLQINANNGVVLGFSFNNDSKDVNLSVRQYIGYNELVYNGENKLEGKYFTNRGKGTHGTINLTKKVKKH